MFIGSNDMNTCKEYSELCGNITVVTSSSSGSVSSNDINLSNQTQVRPLIYPSELQRLNKPGNIGNSIIVTFGNYPLKTYFSPSFKVPFYQMGKMDTSDLSERYFDENAILYSVGKRNEIVFGEVQTKNEEQTPEAQTGAQGEGKEETITFIPGEGVTAIVHDGKQENTEEQGDAATTAEESATAAADSTSTEDSGTVAEADPDELALLALWRSYKEQSPEGTLDGFYRNVSTTNSEVQ
jgi:hypothetical protein